MSIRKYLAATAVASMVMVVSPASAALLDFNIKDDARAINFQVDNNPTNFTNNADRVLIKSTVMLDGISFSNSSINFFGSTDSPESIRILDSFGNDLGRYYGPVLYQGSPTAPTFSVGTIALSDVLSDVIPATLTISLAPTVTPAVPEPTTWAMMLVGFGMVAGAARYRRRSVKVLLA